MNLTFEFIQMLGKLIEEVYDRIGIIPFIYYECNIKK